MILEYESIEICTQNFMTVAHGIKIISAWHKQFEDINDQDYRICFYSKTLIFFLSFILRPLINT